MSTHVSTPPAPEVVGKQRLPRRHYATWGDFAFAQICKGAAILIVVLAALLLAVLVTKSWLAIRTLGVGFFTSKTWDPEPTHRQFGALAFVWGTLATSAIAMLIAVPLGVGTAAYLSEIASRHVRRYGSFLVEMLAAVPSVVFGFWGLFVLAPVLQSIVAAVGGPNHGGGGILPAGLILSIMIVPYIASVSFDVIRAVPASQRAGSLALGATRWQTILHVVLPYARPGIIGGSFLALGRALGETMAVTMLIGNKAVISLSPFSLGNSIPSVIANEFTEATYDLYLSALVELGLVLLAVTMLINAAARVLIWRVTRPTGGRPWFAWGSGRKPAGGVADASSGRGGVADASSGRAELLDPVMPVGTNAPVNHEVARVTDEVKAAEESFRLPPGRPSPEVGEGRFDPMRPVAAKTPVNNKSAHLTDEVMTAVLGLCLLVTVGFLFLILGYLVVRGAGSFDLAFFTKLPAPVGQKGGGLANAFVGSFVLVGLATLFAVPVGLLAAIYLSEYRSDRLGPVVRFIGELLGGVPSIIIGMFAYSLVVVPMGHFSGWAGAFALGVMMIPIVMRAAEESLRLVPGTLRHASYALGANHAQTVMRVIVPAALPAIITAVFLAIARVAGETAPLLLTASSNQYWPSSPNDFTPSLPVYIFTYALSPYDDWHRQAWAAALVLLAVVMVLNFGIRLVAGKRIVMASSAE